MADHEGFYAASEKAGWEDSDARSLPCPHRKGVWDPPFPAVPSRSLHLFFPLGKPKSDPREEGMT